MESVQWHRKQAVRRDGRTEGQGAGRQTDGEERDREGERRQRRVNESE
jgi:hypothetical protein